MIKEEVQGNHGKKNFRVIAFPVCEKGTFTWKPECEVHESEGAQVLEPGVPISKEYGKQIRYAIACHRKNGTINRNLLLRGLNEIKLSIDVAIHLWRPWDPKDSRVRAIKFAAKRTHHMVVLHSEMRPSDAKWAADHAYMHT